MARRERNGAISTLPPLDDAPVAGASRWWRRPGFWVVVLAIFIGVVGLGLTALEYQTRRQQMMVEAHAEFERLSSEVAHRVERRLELPLYALKGMRGLYAAEPEVDGTAFRAYVRSHDLAREFPGMLGIGLVERVERSALDRYLAAVRQADDAQFSVRSAGDQPDLFVLRYMEPGVPGTQAEGFDMGQEPVRRRSLEDALRTGNLTLSPLLQIGTGGQTQPGVLYLLPLERSGPSQPGAGAGRGPSARGVLVAPVAVERLMAGVLDAGDRRLTLALHDGSVKDGARAMLSSSGPVMATSDVVPLGTVRSLVVGQRVLDLTVRAGPGMVPAHGAGQSGVVVVAGVLLTLGAWFMLYAGWRLFEGRSRAARHIRALNFDIKRLATIAEMTDNGIVMTDLAGRVVWTNEAFARRAGYAVEEVIGRRPRDLIGTERDDLHALAEVRARALAGESCRLELFSRSRNGAGFFLDVEIQPWRNPEGEVMGLVQIGTDVTGIRAAQQELEEALARAGALEKDLRLMAAVAEHTFSAVVITDLQLRIQWVNRAFEALSGYTMAEALGKSPAALTDFEKTDPEVVARVNAALKLDHGFKGEALQRSKSGREYWVEFEAHPITNAAGERIGYLGVETDITDRKLSEEALARERARLANIVEGTNAGDGEWNLVTRELRMSQRWGEMLGLGADEVSGMTVDIWFAMVHPEDQPVLEAMVIRHLRGEAALIDIEVRMHHRRGSWRWIHVRARGVRRNARGRFDWVSGTQIDVTERKQKEQIWHSRSEMSGDWYWQTDAQHRFVEVDFGHAYDRDKGALQRNVTVLGRRRDEIPQFDAPAGGWGAFHAAMDRHEKLKGFVYRVRGANGSVGWLEGDGRPRYNDDGEFIGYEGVGRDITERQRMTAELRDSLALVDALFEFIPVPVLLKDRTGRVVRANKAYATMLGEPVESIIGQTSEEFLAPQVAARLADLHRRLLVAPGVQTAEVEYQTRAGRQFDALVSKASMTDSQGTTQALIVTVVDISVQKAAARALEESKVAAESANRAKSAFLASMSHEIRTPMNGVVGMAQVLLGSHLTVDQRRMARTISDSAMALLRVIDDILDFSKIEAGRIELELAPLEVSPLVEGVCESLATVAAARQVWLTVVVEPTVNERVVGDAVRIRQVLNNLVGNAIKFSADQSDRAGRVLVRVDRDGPLLRLRVEDNGIGMNEATVARLFQSFTQGEVSTTRRFGGTGLGLAISKRLVELMGGSIDVQSQLGHGSTFTIRLPLRPTDDQPLPGFPVLTDLECLLVDLQGMPVHTLADWLDRAGARVRMVASCEAAQRVVQASLDPVIVIGPDGVCEPAGVSPPIQWRQLVVGPPHGGAASEASPIRSHLVMLARGSFVQAVARLAHLESAEVIARVSGESTRSREPATAPDVEQARLAGQLILVAEDEPINRAVCQRQLAMLGYACELAENGARALEMWRRGPYALLISDMHMPEMDGYELARQIRSAEGATGRARMPIVALTANALKGESQHALAAGMDDYLTKPISIDLLRSALLRWMPAAGNVPAGPQA